MTTINNLPDYYTGYNYLVARVVDGDWWFWGCYSTLNRAREAAYEIDGDIFTPDEVEEGDL